MRLFLALSMLVVAAATPCNWVSRLEVRYGPANQLGWPVGCGSLIAPQVFSAEPPLFRYWQADAAQFYTIMLIGLDDTTPGRVTRHWAWTNIPGSNLRNAAGVQGPNAFVGTYQGNIHPTTTFQYTLGPAPGSTTVTPGTVASWYVPPFPPPGDGVAGNRRYEFQLYTQSGLFTAANWPVWPFQPNNVNIEGFDLAAFIAAMPAGSTLTPTLDGNLGGNPWFRAHNVYTCAPQMLAMQFPTSRIQCGTLITRAAAAAPPLLQYQNVWNLVDQFTLIIVGVDEPLWPSPYHTRMLEVTSNIPAVNVRNGGVFQASGSNWGHPLLLPGITTNYLAPNPAAGTGIHRYVAILFHQDRTYNTASVGAENPFQYSNPICITNVDCRERFDWVGWVSQPFLKLTRVASNFFRAQNPDVAAIVGGANGGWNWLVWLMLLGGGGHHGGGHY